MRDVYSTAHYPTNWPVRYLCDCKQQGKPITIHEGIAHEISDRAMQIRSDHHICAGKEVAVLLKVPPLVHGGEHAVVKLVGRSLTTEVHGSNFLTEIEFSRFEEDGHEQLKRHLYRRFGSNEYPSLARRA